MEDRNKQKAAAKRKEIIEKFSPHLRDGLTELFDQEEKIKKIISNSEAEKELFKKSPHEFFVKYKIPLSPVLAQRLKHFNHDELMKQEKIILPNGQIINSNTRINIVFD